MDDEVKELALLALKNAFYDAFSGLVNEYINAARGLDTDNFEAQISETANVYSRDLTADSHAWPEIWTRTRYGGTCKHDSIIVALEAADAVQVYLQGRLVFERCSGEWFFVDN